VTFQQFLLILRARKWIVLGVLAGVVLTVLLVSLILPKTYTATTALVIDLKANDPVGGMSAAAQLAPGYLATQIDIIQSERVAQRVAELTRMDKSSLFQEQWRKETNREVSFQSWMATRLQKQLDIRPSRESSVVNIRFSWPDPAFAALVANEFARAYIETTIDLKVGPARQYAQWFSEQTKDLHDKLQLAQSKLTEYEQVNGVLAGDGRFDIENQRLAEISNQLSVAQGQLVDSGARHSEVSSAESLPEVMANGLVSSLKGELARSEAQRSQLLGKLGENHPQVLQLSEEIAELRRRVGAETQRVANSLGTSSRVSATRVAELSAAFEKQKALVLEIKPHYDNLSVLKRDVESAQKAYDFVIQSSGQKNLESQTQQANISVLTPAEPPLEHSSPRMVLNMVVAVFLGGLFGVGTALLLELIDQRVRGSEDLSQFVGIPVLGIIPAPIRHSGFNIRRRPAVA
jgi:chain length determinant protein EpsF